MSAYANVTTAHNNFQEALQTCITDNIPNGALYWAGKMMECLPYTTSSHALLPLIDPMAPVVKPKSKGRAPIKRN